MPTGREKTGNKAKKNKTSFKPGQSGNPSGCSKMPIGLKELARSIVWLRLCKL